MGGALLACIALSDGQLVYDPAFERSVEHLSTLSPVKCLFGNFYFSTFISPFDQSVSVSQFVLQVSKPILAITRLSYETDYIIVADTHVPFWYGSRTNTSSLYECAIRVHV